MNRTDLERLINLGVSLDRDEAARSTEYQALSASLRVEEEERERSKPENIRAEIQQCLEHACCRYLPGWFDQLRMRVTYCNDHWFEPHAASWHVHVAAWNHGIVPPPAASFADVDLNSVMRVVRVPEWDRGLAVRDIRSWIDGDEQKIREWCKLIGQGLGREMEAAKG